jgi:type II secretory pathway pseudopilin PulG
MRRRNTGRASRRAAGGFTLTELLLVLLVLMLLSGVAVINLTALGRGAELDEGVRRLETLLRFARAEAANRGCRVQLRFETPDTEAPLNPAAHSIRVLWEPDPLGQPDHFVELRGLAWLRNADNARIQIQTVRTGSSLFAPPPTEDVDGLFLGGSGTNGLTESDPGSAPTAGAGPIAVLTFYPDGSADSAELTVASSDPDDRRVAVVRLNSLTGRVNHEFLELEN